MSQDDNDRRDELFIQYCISRRDVAVDPNESLHWREGYQAGYDERARELRGTPFDEYGALTEAIRLISGIEETLALEDFMAEIVRTLSDVARWQYKVDRE